MNRRDFLQLFGVAALGIWIPGMMRNYTAQQAILPRGLGLGVNLGMAEDGRAAAMQRALDVLQPGWWYHWRQWPPSAHPGFVPSIQPCPGPGHGAYPLSVATLVGYRGAMASVGGDLTTRCWIIGNEPELSGWTPEQTAAAIVAQVATLRATGIETPVVMAPGCNVTTPEHLDYLDAWRNAAARGGLAYTLAVHIYEHRVDMLDMAWQRFKATLDAGERVIVTECGAGPNRTMAEWLAVMPWFYDLANDPLVQALAPFSAYPYSADHGAYPGMMTLDGVLTPLGEQWMTSR